MLLRVYIRVSRLLALLPALFLCACESAPSPLHPASAVADDLRGFMWLLCAVAGIILAAVTILLIWGVLRTPSQDEEAKEHPFGTHLVWIGGIVIPLAVLTMVFALSIARMVNSGGHGSGPTIEVIGHQWWWEIRYPDSKVITANEIHIPVGERAQIRVTSADVIHGFWVPQLQGKIDAIPGEVNTIDLEAAHPGEYRGECLVFCALQHANMNLLVVAEPRDSFNQWLRGQAAAPAPPATADAILGRQVYQRSACSACHTIGGTSTGTAGPDLTHLASRQQLAAGTIPNTPDNLSSWIVTPQTTKPGNLMPNEALSGPDTRALVAYLEGLK
jgi:cytochrome c oxidase subunit 2